MHIAKNNRPHENPEYRAGSNSGRKQRQKDKATGAYPRLGLPISRADRSTTWIGSYQAAYYQEKATGRPMLGDEPRVTISVTVDRNLLEQVAEHGISRSDAFACGANILLEQLNLDQQTNENKENQLD